MNEKFLISFNDKDEMLGLLRLLREVYTESKVVFTWQYDEYFIRYRIFCSYPLSYNPDYLFGFVDGVAFLKAVENFKEYKK